MGGSTRAPRCIALAIAVGLLGLAVPASPAGAVQIGETFVPSSAGGDFTFIQSSSPSGQHAAPFAGILTSWSFQANPAPPQLKLKVARPVSANSFTIIGESPVEAPLPNALSTFPVGIPVQAGDVIGLYKVTSGAIAEFPTAYTSRAFPGDVPPGATGTSSPGQGRIDVSAILEPDCDNDGLGDETQDTDLTLCDASPPDTTIASGPKSKTRKKSATFVFSGADARVVTGFECSLDGAAFASCTSPHAVKVKKGRHTFSVRAVDANGNRDGSPATFDWKVKKKKQ